MNYILILHRWTEEYIDYARFVDHEEREIRYITSAQGALVLPDSAAEVAIVETMDRAAAVIRAVKAMVSRVGVPEHVVALHEGDLETAAVLRGRLGLAGWRLGDVVPFRDKLNMVERVAAAGLAVPEFAAAQGRHEVEIFRATVAGPVVVKPRRGMGSRGVLRIQTEDELEQLKTGFDEPCVVEAFVDDPIYHVDGVWNGDALGHWAASRYVDVWFASPLGDKLASVEEDDPRLLRRIERFTQSVLVAMTSRPFVFHLELFVGRDGHRITFLEIGARAGGGEIPYQWRAVHGLDLLAVHLGFQVGQPLREPVAHAVRDRRLGGWLEVAPATATNRRLAAAPSASALGPEVHWHRISPLGEVAPMDPVHPAYLARFRLAADTSVAVERAIVALAEQFRFEPETSPETSAQISMEGLAPA